MTVTIRQEEAGDEDIIHALITEAFAGAKHSDGTEAEIASRLRNAGALTLSLVAQEAACIVGHVAFSPVTIDGRSCRWFGLGPVAVDPASQGNGVGSRLITTGLDMLRTNGAAGCVVLGDPAFYGRFGFKADERLVYPGAPSEYFQAIRFDATPASGLVEYHASFLS